MVEGEHKCAAGSTVCMLVSKATQCMLIQMLPLPNIHDLLWCCLMKPVLCCVDAPMSCLAGARPQLHGMQMPALVPTRTSRRVQHTVMLSSHGDANETSTTSTVEQQERDQPQPQPAAAPLAAASNNGTAGTSSNGTSSSNTNRSEDKDAPKHKDWVPDASTLAPLQFTPLSGAEKGWTNFKLLFALPWRRFKPEAVLAFKLEGEISDQLQGRFSPGFSMPQILDSLEKAAVDPRIKGIAVEINPLAVCGVFAQEMQHVASASNAIAVCTACKAGTLVIVWARSGY